MTPLTSALQNMIKSHDDRTRMTRIERIYADFNLPVRISANPPESDLIRVPLPLTFLFLIFLCVLCGKNGFMFQILKKSAAALRSMRTFRV
jgi:hypothetical protein